MLGEYLPFRQVKPLIMVLIAATLAYAHPACAWELAPKKTNTSINICDPRLWAAALGWTPFARAFAAGKQAAQHGELTRAEDHYKEALSVSTSFGQEALCYRKLGEIYDRSGNLAQAEACFKLESSRDSAEGEYPARLFSVSNLLAFYKEHDAPRKAKQLLGDEVAKARNELAPNNHYREWAVNQLVGRHKSARCYAEAEQLIREELVSLDDSRSNCRRAAGLLTALGDVCTDQEREREAEFHYHMALECWRKAMRWRHDNDVLLTLNGLGNLYFRQHKYESAEAVPDKLPNLPAVVEARFINQLASKYKEAGKNSVAERLYKRAIDCYSQANDPTNPAAVISLSGLIEVNRTQGRYEAAERLCLKKIELCNSPGCRVGYPDEPELWTELGEIYTEEKKFHDAERTFARATAVYRSRNASHYAVARCLAAQADCFARQGKYQDAEPIFRYVLAKWPGWPGLPAVSKSYASLLRATDRRVETRFSNTRP